MSFVEQFKQLNWDDISMSIYAKTAQDVERALNKPKRDLEDFKALISPAAEAYLEQMAQLSYSATRKRFGNTMSLYIPLYLSNLCDIFHFWGNNTFASIVQLSHTMAIFGTSNTW